MSTLQINGKDKEIPLAKYLDLNSKQDHAAILQQMERILESRLFRNSHRNRDFLRYVVEHAQKGKKELLKERTLGVAVFGRVPEYDSNLDPVVRITAGEVRKRLAQYYQEPAHAGEIRIDIPAGSYFPEFQLPAEEPENKAPAQTVKRHQRYIWLLVLLPALAILVYLLKPLVFQSVTDQFWNPVCISSLPVILCMPAQSNPVQGLGPSLPLDSGGSKSTLNVPDFQVSDSAPYSDAITAAKLAWFLQARDAGYEIRRPSELTIENMRGRAVIIIGAFDNALTRRMMQGMRYTYKFDKESDEGVITDSLNPSRTIWKIENTSKYLDLVKDFGIITRVWEPRIEHFMVFVGGIGRNATIAGGELVTDPKYLKGILSTAPANWPKKNLQIVFETAVDRGNQGPPHVLATHFW
jgi:hypothetical protein